MDLPMPATSGVCKQKSSGLRHYGEGIQKVGTTMGRVITRMQLLGLLLSSWTLLAFVSVPRASADFAPIYRGGICVADGAGNCIGGDIRAESGLGPQVGYMKTTADPGTVAVYRSTCYSDAAGSCAAWGLSLDVNGTPVGYLSTTAPDTPSASNPLTQSNGLLLQNLGGTASAFLWTVIPPSIASLSVTSGPVGTSVTVSGANFGATQGGSTLTFNGAVATPSSWTATSITAPVPANATSGPVVVTVSGSASNGVNFAVTTKLAIISVNSGASPAAGNPFPVVVQSQDADGNPANVNTATDISLSLKTGTGILGGTLTGTIAAATNQVTLSLVTYTKAESGVVITAARTSGNNLSSGDSAAFMVSAGAASTLAFTNQPGNATAGASIPGPPTVAVRDSFGNTVTSSTASITIAVGTNPGGGTLGGTTTKNASDGLASFTDLSLDKAANGYTLTASASGLTGATSASFNVSAGSAAKLAFTVQPGNSTAGSSVAGPPTVAVQDSFGNTITSSAASITVAIGSNPGGGVLSGTTTRNASSGVAAFAGLSINEAGNGYTLLATSSGLTSATSSAFNVTSTGGTIAGVITRYSNGTAISGALVEAIQGGSVVASATTNGSGSYSISGLSAGAYTVRAWFVGFVPQILNGVTVITGSTTTVNLSLNVGIAIHSPVAGAQINDHTALVSGMFDTSLGEVGINVNGYVALQDGDEFALMVPLEATTTSLTATVTSASGTVLASHTIPIAVQTPATVPVLNFRPSPVVAFVGEAVTFHLTSQNAMSQVQLDGNGDGTIDFTGSTLDGVTVTFAEPGLYYPTVVVTEPDATTRSATTLVQVLDMIQLDAMLVIKWNAMKNALRSGDTAGAVDYIVKSKRSVYQNVFNNLAIPFSGIDQALGNISYVGQRGLNVEYEMFRQEGADWVSYMVLFSLDEDGVWRIKFF